MFAEIQMSPGPGKPPTVVHWLRWFGIVAMTVLAVLIATDDPGAGLSGDGLVVSLALVAYAVGVLWSFPRRPMRPGVRLVALLAVLLACVTTMAVQPNGSGIGGLYYVVVITAMRFSRPVALGMLVLTVVSASIASAIAGTETAGIAGSLTFSLIPWVLVLGLLRELHTREAELRASRAAEAETAVQAERGRLGREMHDVLAHSLSALSLQLEGARLLARDRDADPEVVDAIERARHLATSGLDEARGAIAALRGDALPGPDRLPLLVEAFAAHSDVTCALDVRGEAPALTSEARLALYRTAQEALTNVRRHSAARHVDVRLTYAADGATLVVEDHGPGAPVAVGAVEGAGGGYGLTGMRERAELLGGRLTAGPTLDGFRVELWVPA